MGSREQRPLGSHLILISSVERSRGEVQVQCASDCITDTEFHEHQVEEMNLVSFPAAGEPASSEWKMNMSKKLHAQHCCKKAACLFLSHPDSRNNHTETILFKSLFGPLALVSYWYLLHLNLTHLH